MNIVPKRGIVGGALTVAALALILSFKTPDMTGLATGGQSRPVTGATSGQGGTATYQSQPSPSSGANSGATSGANSGATSSPGSGAGQKAGFSGQLTGSAVQTPYGTVQVQVTLQNGKITDVQALQMPGDFFRSQQISQYAAPQLRSEVLSAQSAQVNTISGATYTSMGYLQSLQSALDQAGA
ncbi:MAG: FMN-binding protein [Candidatus Limnocylindrales bacterium]|jgi:uncharacterized protein with FMN-binding domain